MTTEIVNRQESIMHMKTFCAKSPASIAKNVAPMQYAMNRNFGDGFAIRITEDKILIRANLW